MGGEDIPLIDNTYGLYFDFGSIPGRPNYKGYRILWQSVLVAKGEGTYQLRVNWDVGFQTAEEFSVVFKLKRYSAENAAGTVRIQSIQNGYLRHLDMNYKDLNWIDGVRFRGMFGNNSPEHQKEYIIYANRESRQLRDEIINNYVLKSLLLPSCITEPILKYHNLANYLKITDYNAINHRKDYVDKEVVFETVEDIEYQTVTDKAILTIGYKDYLQNFQKSNC